MDWEFGVLDYIQNYCRNDFLDMVMSFWSGLGTISAIWIVLTVILLIFKKTRRIGWVCVIGFILCFLIGNCIFKPIIARIRPYDINTLVTLIVPKEHDYSFPSGHTMFAMCFATILFCKNKLIGLFSFIFAAIMAFSRLYLYMHFPTDVLFGAILGIAIGFFSVYIADKLFERYKTKKISPILSK